VQATERVRNGLRAVIFTGTAAGVDRYLAEARADRRLVGHDRPTPAGPGRWRVRAVLWHVVEPVRVPRTQLPPPPGRRVGWSPDPATVARVVWWAVGVAVVCGVGWLVWQATRSAAEWAAANPGLLVAGGLGAGALGLSWASRKLRRPCPGQMHHCPRCPHGGGR
jgi:hypothetical protein